MDGESKSSSQAPLGILKTCSTTIRPTSYQPSGWKAVDRKTNHRERIEHPRIAKPETPQTMILGTTRGRSLQRNTK